MAFDKTGTLVKAKPLVADLASLSEIAGDKSLQMAALSCGEKGFKKVCNIASTYYHRGVISFLLRWQPDAQRNEGLLAAMQPS